MMIGQRMVDGAMSRLMPPSHITDRPRMPKPKAISQRVSIQPIKRATIIIASIEPKPRGLTARPLCIAE